MISIPVASDSIFFHPGGFIQDVSEEPKGFYFWDETEANYVGPFPTYTVARKELNRYVKMLEDETKEEPYPKFTHTRGSLVIPWKREAANTATDVTEQMSITVEHEYGPDQAEMDMLRLTDCWNACEESDLSNQFLSSGGIQHMIELLRAYVADPNNIDRQAVEKVLYNLDHGHEA